MGPVFRNVTFEKHNFIFLSPISLIYSSNLRKIDANFSWEIVTPLGSNVSWTSLGPLLKCSFCNFSKSDALFKSQLLTLIRIGLLNMSFNVGLNSCRKMCEA